MNYQSLGKELMSQDEISVMDGSKCILQVRGVRPFLSTKYDIEKHPNYKYLADFDPKLTFNIVEFIKVFVNNKAKLLEGMNKRNTKHIRIEINEDNDVSETEKASPQQNISPSVPAVKPTSVEKSDMFVEPTETEIMTAEPINQSDISADNYDDEDDEDSFDPDDTELV
jgi:hypothetical protein